MTQNFKNETEEYYHKSRELFLYCFHVEAKPNKPWDYEYLFQKNIYPGQDKKKATVEKWIDIFPPEKLNFSALSQHHHIDDTWIYQFPLAEWDLHKLSNNKNFSFQMVFHCPEFALRPWDWSQIRFKSEDVTLDTYLKILHKDWNLSNYGTVHIKKEWLKHIPESVEIYHLLSVNRYLKTEWLLTKPDAPWDISALFHHPSKKSNWYQIIKSDKWPFHMMTTQHGVTLETLQAYPDSPWNFPKLSSIYLITLKWLLAFPEAAWDFQEVSKNSNLDISWLLSFPNADWNFTILSSKLNISIEWVNMFPKAPWNYNKIAKHIYLEYIWVELYPDISWDFKLISSKIRDPIKWLSKYPKANWDFTELLLNEQITIDLIKLIPLLPHHFDILSESPFFKIEWINQYPLAPWNFTKLSMRREINLEWIEEFPDANWSFTAIDWNLTKFRQNPTKYLTANDKWHSKHQSKRRIYHVNDFYRNKFKLSWFEKFPNLKWDYSHISNCIDLSLEFLQRHSDKPWDFQELSYNNNITLEFLTYYPNADWDFDALSIHPNLKLKWIESLHPEKWNYSTITYHNSFDIKWLERFPRANWNVTKLFYDYKNTYVLAFYQFYHPNISVIEEIIPLLRNRRNIHFCIPLMLLHPKNKTFYTGDLGKLGYWESKELNEVERWNVVRLCQAKYNFKHFYPDVIYHIDYDLELQNLSGDSFFIPGWFDNNDIIGTARLTYPEQGKFEILISKPNHDKDFMASQHTNKDLKNMLLCQQDGPSGMLVYQDEEAIYNQQILPSQEDEGDFKYFDLW